MTAGSGENRHADFWCVVDVGESVGESDEHVGTERPLDAIQAKQLLTEAPTVFDGMADLRWVLMNCNEFRFLP